MLKMEAVGLRFSEVHAGIYTLYIISIYNIYTHKMEETTKQVF